VDDQQRMQLAQVVEGPLKFIEPPSTPREPEAPSPSLLQGPLTFIEPTPPREATAAPSVGIPEDIARGALSGIAQGVPETLGLPAMAARGWSAATQSAATPISAAGEQFVPPSSQWSAPTSGVPGRKVSKEFAEQMQEPGVFERIVPSIPTAETFKGLAESYIPGYKTAAEYKPASVAGQLAQAGFREIPTSVALPFGGGPALRAATGVASGVGGESAKKFAEQTSGLKEYQLPAQLAGSLVGGVGAGLALPTIGKFAAAPFRRGEPAARRALTEALERDIAEAPVAERGIREDILRRAATSGVSPDDLTPAALLGPRGRLLLASSANTDDINRINTEIAQISRNAPDNAARDLAAIVGKPSPISYTNEQVLRADATRLINDPNYKFVMSLPWAKDVPNQNFSKVFDFDLFKDQIGEINRLVQPVQARLGIQIPDVKTGSNGNLAYWDFAKKHFDRLGNTDVVRRDSYRAIAKEIRDSADAAVPQYRLVRDKAAEQIGYNNALELGHDLISRGSKGATEFLNQVKNQKVLRSMGETERENLRLGMIGAATDKIISNPAALKELYGADFAKRLSVAFSPKEIANIQGIAARNALLAKAAATPIREISGPKGAIEALAKTAGASASTGAGLGYIAGVAANLFTQQTAFTPDWKHVAGLLGGAIYGASVNRAQKRAMEQVVRLSSDPRLVVQLGEQLQKSPSMLDAYRRLNDFMSDHIFISAASRAGLSGMQDRQPDQPPPLTIRPGRATGGAVNLRALANAAKKHVTRSTQDLLNEHDDTVAKALEVANKHI